jgi:hypothetical protein
MFSTILIALAIVTAPAPPPAVSEPTKPQWRSQEQIQTPVLSCHRDLTGPTTPPNRCAWGITPVRT